MKDTFKEQERAQNESSVDSLSQAYKEDVKLDVQRSLVEKVDVVDEFVSFDFSKTHIENKDILTFRRKMEKKGVEKAVNAMFEGDKINFTENRSVLHTALRDGDVIKKASGGGRDKVLSEEKECVHAELMKIKGFCEKIHGKALQGVTNKCINTVVNIGIGGSDLGPRIICEALECYKIPGMRVFFVSNIDPSEMKHVLCQINLEETLFVVVSKTFTTQETISNAKLALDIACTKMKKEPSEVSNKHFVAVSSNVEEVSKFGINNVFAMWDFVGGRYSLWSAAGLSIALYTGFDHFLRLLSGGSAMDRHFRRDPLYSSSALHAMIEIHYGSLGYPTKCIVPYDFYMRSFYLHIQQLEMESNGKTSTKSGRTQEQTGMIVWGGVGTNSQHSFFQLLHQGTHKVLCEFLIPLVPEEEFQTEGHSHHTILVANCLAQCEALMKGQASSDLNKNFDGNKPSITISYSKLTPETLGALVAHYEHKVLIQGLYWGINSFDQFGVQLGKKIATSILKGIEDPEDPLNYSASTKSTIELVRMSKK